MAVAFLDGSATAYRQILKGYARHGWTSDDDVNTSDNRDDNEIHILSMKDVARYKQYWSSRWCI